MMTITDPNFVEIDSHAMDGNDDFLCDYCEGITYSKWGKHSYGNPSIFFVMRGIEKGTEVPDEHEFFSLMFCSQKCAHKYFTNLDYEVREVTI